MVTVVVLVTVFWLSLCRQVPLLLKVVVTTTNTAAAAATVT
jgi:hypothetical protein